MSYSRPALGFFGVDDIAAASAVASGAGKVISSVTNLFDPGKSRDQQREARANFFRDAALLGSITAARYLIGGTQNTGGNERPYYQAAISKLQGTPIGQQAYSQAQIQGALWAAGIPDPQGTQSMVDNVKRDLQQLQQAAPPAPTNTPNLPTMGVPSTSYPSPSPSVLTSGAHPLPGMTTTAPFNYTPWLIGGGAALFAMAMRKR